MALYAGIRPGLAVEDLWRSVAVMGVGGGLVAGQVGALALSSALGGQQSEATGLFIVFRDVGRALGWASLARC